MRQQWDLADLYRDRLTLRQLWVRLKALPGDSPLHDSLVREREEAEEARRAADLDDALNRYRKG